VPYFSTESELSPDVDRDQRPEGGLAPLDLSQASASDT
jgi:hypothetical protein